MSYKVEILRGALKQLKKIPSELEERIQIKIDDLATEPCPNEVKKLKGKENAYRIRVGELSDYLRYFRQSSSGECCGSRTS